MTPKERVLATLNRQPIDRIPVDLWHTPEIAAALRAYCSAGDDLSMWQALGLDKIAWVSMDYRTPAGDRVAALSGTGEDAASQRSQWGVPLKDVQAGAALYSEVASAPLIGYDDPATLDDYPWWPDVNRFDYDAAVEQAQFLSQYFAVLGPWVSFFEIYCQLRGLEQALIDLVENPVLVEAVLDRLEAIQTEMLHRFYRRAAKYVDLGLVSDDLGGQQSLLMSPRSWERHLRPRLQRWCELIHGYGLKVFYHTDGAARPLLGPIIDCGIDVLNPIQHACPGMDMAELKKEFGQRVIFHGGVENQYVLPRGTVAEVRAEVLDCLRTLGAGREGYICCSCHNVQPGTPIENVLTMIETVQKS